MSYIPGEEGNDALSGLMDGRGASKSILSHLFPFESQMFLNTLSLLELCLSLRRINSDDNSDDDNSDNNNNSNNYKNRNLLSIYYRLGTVL